MATWHGRSHARERRRFLKSSLGIGGALLVGCSDDGGAGPDGGVPACEELEGAELLGTLPFVGEGDAPLETSLGAGLDGRLYTDLEKLEPGSLIIDAARFYVRTAYPDLLVPPDPWVIAVAGARDPSPVELLLPDLEAHVAPMGTCLLECSGNGDFAHFGMLSAADWSGIPFEAVLATAPPRSGATRVLVSGFDDHSQPSTHSTPGASWIFGLAEMSATRAFLATEMNGAPLPPDHGAPVRLIVPGYYGCTCIKWVNEIRYVDDDEPATSQMKEFASRTHQDGTPALARDYRPASMDLAAMPVRVEQWRSNGSLVYRVVGVMWGGQAPTNDLSIRFSRAGGESESSRVAVCPPQTQNRTWTLWSHLWRPAAGGLYDIALAALDPAVPTRRLDAGFYVRSVLVDAV